MSSYLNCFHSFLGSAPSLLLYFQLSDFVYNHSSCRPCLVTISVVYSPLFSCNVRSISLGSQIDSPVCYLFSLSLLVFLLRLTSFSHPITVYSAIFLASSRNFLSSLLNSMLSSSSGWFSCYGRDSSSCFSHIYLLREAGLSNFLVYNNSFEWSIFSSFIVFDVIIIQWLLWILVTSGAISTSIELSLVSTLFGFLFFTSMILL